VFLDPQAEAFYDDWERAASECVAFLRSAAGRDPDDRDLSDLVSELETGREAFRTRWAAPDVRFHNSGVKRFHHRVVGKLSLNFNHRLDIAARAEDEPAALAGAVDRSVAGAGFEPATSGL
jgi:MmyB-like transcription regulator ligand binding domain